VSDAQIEIIAQEYIQLLPDNNLLFDGAFEILDYLNENYKHIITNGFAEVQGRKIKMLSCMIIFILSQTLYGWG
jgi:putative hydrolase of the HAD superfamily